MSATYVCLRRLAVVAGLMLLLLACTLTVAPPARAADGAVTVKVEKVTMPTYQMGPDEKQPLFRGFDIPGMRVFRGTRSTYPYPKMDNFSHEKKMVEYDAITIENEYIKAVIMPDLRGRLQGAYDKRNGWDYLYYNRVIKPGDIAVRAGWISGGLEWNHPGGHGYTQFSRISHKIIENEDGSKTVLVAEIEPVRMMKWETAITLRPGSMAVETEGRFYGIEQFPVPFASSLNGAMRATEEMEMIYPEGTWITGHGKHYVEPWPVYDGIDHRWFKNLNYGSYSIFAEQPTEDFFGCYSHDKAAGTVIVADHRTAPGKKYFSWGSHPAGRRWDTLLSDEDGPYIELQLGGYWDNLGFGYAWLDPMEYKDYVAYWYPVKDIGGFVTANEHFALNLKPEDGGKVMIGIEAVHLHPNVDIAVQANGKPVYSKKSDLSPAAPLIDRFTLPSGVAFEDLKVTLTSAKGNEVLSYQRLKEHPPKPWIPPRQKPVKDLTMDELFMWGKSYYHDPFGHEAEEHFAEMLRREPMDARANREMGLIHVSRGEWRKAKEHLNRSLEQDPLVGGFLTRHYLALAEMHDGNLKAAKEHFVQTARFARLKASALYNLAVIAMREGNHREAVRLLNDAIEGGGIHSALWSTQAVALRKMGNDEAAKKALAEALRRDELDFLAMLEQWRRGELPESEIHAQFDRKDPSFVGSQLYVEGAVMYANLGAWEDAAKVLEIGRDYFARTGRVFAMIEYYLGYCHEQLGRTAEAKQLYVQASRRDSTYVFPFRPLGVEVLRTALKTNPEDTHGWMYLGNALFFLRRYEEANQAWARSLEYDPQNPTALRNLALGRYTVDPEIDEAIKLMERAAAADKTDPRILLELDYFLDAARMTQRRAELLAEREATVMKRDELALAWAKLLLRQGDYPKAVQIMTEKRFFARESRAQTHAVHAEAHYGVGESLLKQGKAKEALEHFRAGMEYPENLGEGELAGEIFARAKYLMGEAHEALGERDAARKLWEEVAGATVQKESEAVVYQALSLRKLGRAAEAETMLRELIDRCKKALSGSEAGSPARRFVLSRAYEALGNRGEAQSFLDAALEADQDAVLLARIEASKPNDLEW